MPDIRHDFVSTVTDDATPAEGVIQPSHWNHTHDMSGTAGAVVGFDLSGHAADLALGPGLSSDGATLDVSPTVIGNAIALAIALG
jgi:hypothetical protein